LEYLRAQIRVEQNSRGHRRIVFGARSQAIGFFNRIDPQESATEPRSCHSFLKEQTFAPRGLLR
jgi:hypothetical protein